MKLFNCTSNNKLAFELLVFMKYLSLFLTTVCQFWKAQDEECLAFANKNSPDLPILHSSESKTGLKIVYSYWICLNMHHPIQVHSDWLLTDQILLKHHDRGIA